MITVSAVPCSEKLEVEVGQGPTSPGVHSRNVLLLLDPKEEVWWGSHWDLAHPFQF